MLAEAKIPPITFRLKLLGSNYVTRALSNPDHPVIQSLQQMARVQEQSTKVLRGQVPWIYTCYADIEPVGHLIAKDVRPLECSLPIKPCWLREAFCLRRVKKPRHASMAAKYSTKN
jgi:hypothetical protein